MIFWNRILGLATKTSPRLAMDLDLGPEIEQFRAELRGWIAAKAPPALAGLTDWTRAAIPGGYRAGGLAAALAHPAYARWERTLADAKLICPQWPAEFGGQGMDAIRVAVLNEEFSRAGVPRVIRGMGETLVGPSLIVHATREQREHFLPRIISAEDVYCQGFSEPDHGSDLAAVQTRGEIDGDEIVITGQKLWTSGAAGASMMFVLCRTDPRAGKQQGLSYVLIPFTGPQVRYRPIRQLSGAAEFYEDFLDGVRVPLFNVIGGLNNGWRVAMTTLGHERGGSATVQHLRFEREFWELVQTAREHGRTADPLVRQQLAWAYTGVQLMRFSGLRTLARVAAGRPPGPEASVSKLFWSEYHKRLGEIAMGIIGPEGLLRPDGDGYPTSPWQNVFLSSRAGTIYSGTSEIQRTIIAERALGLPKEPRAAG
jgi:alkylation response protein AidB-like acyl-CoA dehydrogenase